MSERVRGQLVSLSISIGVAAVALALSFLLIGLSGNPAGEAAQALWDGAFGDADRVAATLAEALPLTLVALGWCVAFTARRINVGLEGQILIGGVLAAVVGLELNLPSGVHLAVAVCAGMLGGAAWAGVAAWLWARRGVNEIISTLMLNLVAIQVVAWLVRGPLQEPAETFAQTAPIPDSALWPTVPGSTVLGYDVLLALLAVAGVALLLTRTRFGFHLRLTGGNEHAARAAGVNTSRASALALLASGGLAGLAGSSLLLGGESTTMTDNFSGSRGFEGIAVALLARNSPVACIPAALLFAALEEGGGLMEARVGIPSSLVLITQGTVIVLVAAAGLLTRRASQRRVDAQRRTPTPGQLAPGMPGAA